MAVKTERFNLMVEPDELDEISRLADEAGVSRAELFRKALKIMINFIAHEKPLIEKEIREKLLKEGKLPSNKELTKQREIMLERELNRMAYGEILKATRNEKK